MRVRHVIGPLEERDFRLLFLARAFSLLGDGLVPVALAFAVLNIERSASALGLVLAAGTVPRVVFLLVGGVWADRLPRHLVMVASDLLRFASQSIAAALLISGNAEIWHLALLAFVHGTGAAFFLPASTGLIPQTVSPGRLQQANGLLSLTGSGFAILGPVVVNCAPAGASSPPAPGCGSTASLLRSGTSPCSRRCGLLARWSRRNPWAGPRRGRRSSRPGEWAR